MARNNAFEHDDPQNRMLARVDTDRLGQMSAVDGGYGAPRANYLPTTFAEAMELAKLMAAGNFMPKHLRGKPGDCLAVVMQAQRWAMDPFAVGNKTYFVNDRMAYEAQLVVAVVNTSGRLKESLDVVWHGAGEELRCVVTGTLRGETKAKVIEQEIKTIKVRNSPLWVQAPRIQLGYYTQRAFARLFCPEVLLGVYTVDEIEEMGMENARDVPGNVRRAPTRQQIAERVIDTPIRSNQSAADDDDDLDDDAESEEEIARRLDAQTMRGTDADDDDDDDVDANEPLNRSEERQLAEAQQQSEPEKAKADPAPAQVEQKSAAPVQDDVKPADIDWNSWINKFNREISALATVDEVNAHWQKRQGRYNQAPAGTKNRAKAMYEAALRKLAPPVTTTKPEDRTDAVAAAIGGGDDDASPATKKADEIIGEMNRKSTIIDLRACKAKYDPDIDAMDEDNAGRVTRAYRALEDKLTRKPN